jgi:hypothetical protein
MHSRWSCCPYFMCGMPDPVTDGADAIHMQSLWYKECQPSQPPCLVDRNHHHRVRRLQGQAQGAPDLHALDTFLDPAQPSRACKHLEVSRSGLELLPLLDVFSRPSCWTGSCMAREYAQPCIPRFSHAQVMFHVHCSSSTTLTLCTRCESTCSRSIWMQRARRS